MKKLALALAASTALYAVPAFADQPEMKAALDHISAAQDALNKATHDKGGHRAKALELLKQAQAEVQAGIDFDKTHTGPNENKR